MMFFLLIDKYAPITKYTFIVKPVTDGIIPVKDRKRSKPRNKIPKCFMHQCIKGDKIQHTTRSLTNHKGINIGPELLRGLPIQLVLKGHSLQFQYMFNHPFSEKYPQTLSNDLSFMIVPPYFIMTVKMMNNEIQSTYGT